MLFLTKWKHTFRDELPVKRIQLPNFVIFRNSSKIWPKFRFIIQKNFNFIDYSKATYKATYFVSNDKVSILFTENIDEL